MECIQFKEAHDAEILTVSYSTNRKDELLLATGSRDRLIHIFDVNDNYNLLTTLDDHSSSITSLRFATEGSKLLSCSADKSIIFRNINRDPFNVTRYHQAIVQYGTVYDMDVDPINKFIVTSGQDKKLSIYTISTGKPARSYKVEETSGEVIKVRLDPAGIYAATSSSDKNIRLYDYWTGECLAKLSGHSELVTGLVFTPNCKRLISVSGDSCIFVWRLSQDLTSNIQERLTELKLKSMSSTSIPKESASPTAAASNNTNSTIISTTDVDLQINVPEEEEQEEEPFALNDTSLPAWAKGKGENKQQAEKFAPRGRWAQRVNPNEGVPLFSELSDVEKPIAKLLENIERRYTIEISPEDKENFLGTWRLARQMQHNVPLGEDERPLTQLSKEDKQDSIKQEETVDNNNPAVLSISPKQMTSNRLSLLPTPEEEDGVLYSSDTEDDIEEDTTSNNQQPNQQTLDADTEVTEYYGQSPRSTPAFESDIQLSDAKATTEEEKKEEAEEIADEESSNTEEFLDPEKADFLKSNFLFDNNAALAKKTNVTRLSISSKFLLRPPQDIKLTMDTSSVDAKLPPVSKKQDAAFAKELEKVKQRLAQMGLSYNNPHDSETGASTDSPPPATLPTVINEVEQVDPTEDSDSTTTIPIQETPIPQSTQEDEDVEKDLQILKESLTGPLSNLNPIISMSPSRKAESTSVPVSETTRSTLPLPLDYYSKSLYEFQSSLDNFINLFKEIQQFSNNNPSDSNVSSLLATFTNTLQSSQQTIGSSLSSTSETPTSYQPLATATMSSTNLLLTSSIDLNKTIEMYSNMLLQAVKDKLEKK